MGLQGDPVGAGLISGECDGRLDEGIDVRDHDGGEAWSTEVEQCGNDPLAAEALALDGPQVAGKVAEGVDGEKVGVRAVIEEAFGTQCNRGKGSADLVSHTSGETADLGETVCQLLPALAILGFGHILQGCHHRARPR